MSEAVRVRFNADDFGLTDGVCRGIVDSMTAGVVGTTSVMPCVPGAEERVRSHAPPVSGRIGVHLQLTGGIPVSPADQVPSLVTAEGRFPSRREDLDALDPDELLAEWRRQFERIRSWGIEPTHVDSHHHVHTLPEVLPTYRDLASTFGVAARGWERLVPPMLRAADVACEDRCIIDWYDDDLTIERLIELIVAALDEVPAGGSIEVACHPGYYDAALEDISSYAGNREVELDVLSSADLRVALERLGVVLVTAPPAP